MANKKYYVVLAVIMMYLSLLSCSDLKIGVGLKGVILDENKITLDGDTFDIRERIGDSLLIVWNYTHSNDRTPCYLLKYERNGFYYPQIGGSDITSIDNTTDFVSIDDKEVYDIKDKKCCSCLNVMHQDCTILANGATCIFLQTLIRFVSPMGNMLDFKMMCSAANQRKTVC